MNFMTGSYAGHYAGISVMVARHGKLVKSGFYGCQTLEGREPLREDAIYRIASMTKPIIAVAMLLLYEEGKWQLDRSRPAWRGQCG
jgi:CubicO group peptidase (beta-lactamase class C family)